jgi:hypothetical protein
LRIDLVLIAFALIGTLAAGETAKKKAPPVKPAAAKTTATAKKSVKTSASKKGKRNRTPKQTWRNRQLAPSPERYSEIQRALIHKGYLQAPATGQWDQASTDALKKFQQEQNIEASGKIDSLSLIALGLGPKYDTAAVTAPPLPPPAEAVKKP